jgi:aerobic C4-dicarboxylate transport protein
MATHGTAAATTRQPLYKSLFFQVVVALVLGIAVGAVFPDLAQALKPLGDGFIKLIKMIIGPIVFCVVVLGIAQAGDLKKVGRVGVKAVLYFEVVTSFALLIGIILAYAFQPGVGMNIDPSTLDPSAMAAYTGRVEEVKHGTVDFLMKIIPVTVVDGNWSRGVTRSATRHGAAVRE